MHVKQYEDGFVTVLKASEDTGLTVIQLFKVQRR